MRSTPAAAARSGIFSARAHRGLIGNAAGGINRGVAVAGDKIFMVTDNAHLLALNRAGRHDRLGNRDGGLASELQRHFRAACRGQSGDQRHGGRRRRRARFRRRVRSGNRQAGCGASGRCPRPANRAPKRGRARASTHGGAAAWFTGVYDAETDTVFWQAGNPGEDYNGDDREGDNLYSDCILALDAKTGKLKWHYQTTPHDLWDWDTTETPLVIDANWQGQPRKLLVQGNRNGFFYVFDRTNGKLLLAKQFIKELTWATASVRMDGP